MDTKSEIMSVRIKITNGIYEKKKLSKNRQRKLTTRKYCFTLLRCVVKVPTHGQQKT